MDDGDLVRMQALVSRTSRQSGRHPGQVAWRARSLERTTTDAVRFWTEHGHDAAWAWAPEPSWLEVCVDVDDAHAVDAAREAVGWFLEQAPATVPARTLVRSDEHLLLAVLAEAGFVPATGPSWTHHRLDLARLPATPSVPGYRLKPVGGGEAAPRAACHRAARSAGEHPSRVTTASYDALMATPAYRSDLDWVAVAAAGAWVASCLGWLDPATGEALLEPVGCAPEHRRPGLVRAVGLAALHAARAAGATAAWVCPRDDSDHALAQTLCRELGFEPGERTVTLVREP